MPSLSPILETALKKDRQFLETTKLPIVTVSATYREDLKEFLGLPEPEDETIPDIVFSRAHYSMATAVAMVEWKHEMRPEYAWVVDPTNYVTHQDWSRIIFTEAVGKTLARNQFLKRVKDLVDQFGRNKLPILKSITPPLLNLTHRVNRPILSLHIAAGNILARHGKTVVQVITDPHVRSDYLDEAERENISFCVFDSRTKTEFLEKAAIFGKNVPANRVIVTGPPVDPRVVAARKGKTAWRSGHLHLCLTTGGLGTNKSEIKTILKQLLPELKKPSCKIRLLVYAGTQHDIADLVTHQAKNHELELYPLEDDEARLRLIYHPQIVDANEQLIEFGFPWADGFITKPSGDMAYDAAAAGCFFLTLKEWGVWEHNIREIFEQKEIARPAHVDHIYEQLQFLMQARKQSQSWIERAMNQAFHLDKQFLEGAQHIALAVEAHS